MHETFSPNYSGHVDTIEYYDDRTEIDFWVVSNISDDPVQDFKVIDREKNSVVKVDIQKIKRQGVYEAYNCSLEKYLYSGFKIKVPKEVRDATLLIKSEIVFEFHLRNYEGVDVNSVIKKNDRALPDIVVVDNFYEDPDKVREFALMQTFEEKENESECGRTNACFTPSWVKESFEKLLGREIKEFTSGSGAFFYNTSLAQEKYHFDEQEYAAIVFLTPGAPIESGIKTHKSKRNDLRCAAKPVHELIFNMTKERINLDTFGGNNFYDGTNMTTVDVIGNIYNRLILFNSRLIHSDSFNFGNIKANSKLFQAFFFNCK